MPDISILDVGHGNAAIVRDGEMVLVVDAGSGTSLLEHLQREGITRIFAIMISHADIDHLKGLVALLDQEDIQIDTVYVNSDAKKTSRQWAALVYDLDERKRKGKCDFKVDLTEGISLELSESAKVEVIAPRQALAATGPGAIDTYGNRVTTNTISAVIKISLSDRRILLTGDLDEVGLKHLVETRVDVSADILVFPHHGGDVSPRSDPSRNAEFTKILLSAVKPDLVVFSIGRTKYRNPRPEIVQSVISFSNCQVMCTQMSRHCLPNDQKLPSDHLADLYSDGRRRGHCCAGSIRVSPVSIEPSLSTHGTFVAANASTALCRRTGE